MNGLKPRKDRWYHARPDFHKKFGTTSNIPDFNLLDGKNLPIPDQNEPDTIYHNPALPFACTGFSASYVGSIDKNQYANPRFTYDCTLEIEGGTEGDECTLYDAFVADTVYGIKFIGATERRAAPLAVRPVGAQDWYAALISAAYTSKLPVAVGTTWLPEWEQEGGNGSATGIISTLPTGWQGGHAWLIIGQKTIGGIPHAIGLTWNGPNWGAGGLAYFPWNIINATMEIEGSDALTNHAYTTADLATTIIIIQQTIISYLRRAISSFKS